MIARDHLAAVDADASLEADAPDLVEVLIERRERVAHLGCGSNGTQRIVLVHDRYAEDRHHGVADELLHDAAVTLDHRAHRVEIAAHETTVRLGVELLAQSRRVDEVGEENRDVLPDLGQGLRVHHRSRAARGEENRRARVLPEIERRADGGCGAIADDDLVRLCETDEP